MNASISLVTVNLNGSAHLDQLLESIASQTLSPVETLVIDNGSNDSSELVVRRHSAQWHPVGRNIG
ncbi:MAG: glycosyltransferase, partial [Actinobacteria bacterium]|nr:glycosyltransferase [Actinomycetota bacterium]